MIFASEIHIVNNATQKELIRSIRLHGDWDNLSFTRMFFIILAELAEVAWAIIRRDYSGPHGMFIESAQVAACMQKLMVQVIRRQK